MEPVIRTGLGMEQIDLSLRGFDTAAGPIFPGCRIEPEAISNPAA
jgi:hypothetical protein